MVLRGEGMGDTGTILVGTGTGRAPAPAGAAPVAGGGPGGGFGGGQATLVHIAGASGVTTKDETKQIDHRRVRAGRRAQLQGGIGRGFRRGDTVIVRRMGNEEWIAAIGMNGETQQSRWKPFNWIGIG